MTAKPNPQAVKTSLGAIPALRLVLTFEHVLALSPL